MGVSKSPIWSPTAGPYLGKAPGSKGQGTCPDGIFFVPTKRLLDFWCSKRQWWGFRKEQLLFIAPMVWRCIQWMQKSRISNERWLGNRHPVDVTCIFGGTTNMTCNPQAITIHFCLGAKVPDGSSVGWFLFSAWLLRALLYTLPSCRSTRLGGEMTHL